MTKTFILTVLLIVFKDVLVPDDQLQKPPCIFYLSNCLDRWKKQWINKTMDIGYGIQSGISNSFYI